jgi:glutamyl-tRNA synthetase
MMNYLVNLGWNDGTDKEIYTPDELIAAFDLNRIIKSPAVFDMDKLRWVNSQHIKLAPKEKILSAIAASLSSSTPTLFNEASANSSKYLDIVSKMCHDKLEVINDARTIVSNALGYSLEETIANDPHVGELIADGFLNIAETIIRDYESGVMPKGSEETFSELWKTYVKNLGKELGKKGKSLFHPIRLAVTGTMSGPDVGDQLQLLSLSQEILPSDSQEVIFKLDKRISTLKDYVSKVKSSV